MATPPRNNSRSKPSSRAKKPTTIDLDAKDVKDTSASAKAGNDAEGGSKENTKKSAPASSKKPVESAKVSEPGKPDDTPPKPAADAKPVKTSTGFLKLAIAGIIGGLITLVGGGAMLYGGLLPSPVKTIQPQPVPPAPVVDLTPLQTKIGELQSKIQNIEANVAPIVDLTPIETRIGELEKSSEEISTASNSNPELAGQLDTLKSQLATLSKTARGLEDRIAALASAASTATDQAAPSGLTATKITELIEISRQNSEGLGTLEKKFEALTSKVDKDVDARIAKFDAKLSNMATGKKLANSVAINALKSALQNGDPYLAALTSLETLNGSSNPLEILKQSAATGIISTKNLSLEFRQLQGEILRAASNDPQAGLTERMMASIKSLVTISSDAPISGDTPLAIISRIDDNLKTGNLNQALVEWKSLPQSARQMSQPWMEKLGQRMEAENQFSELVKTIQAPIAKAAD